MIKKTNKYLFCIIIFLTLGIICKQNTKYKEIINNKLYEENINFSYFENIYTKYLGGIFPIENIKKITNIIPVFNEELIYTNKTKYKEGVKLEVTNNYLVPNQEKGIIIYIGEKQDYGNVIIIETDDNKSIWYGNICNYDVKLYDHLNKGDIIGETCTNELYLVYKKDKQVIDYKEYLQ